METLLCIAIVALLALGTGSLIANATGIFRSSVFTSDSASLSGTLNAALTDLLRTSSLSPASGGAPENAAYISGTDGKSYFFSGTGLNFNAEKAYFSWDGGILKAVSSDGTAREIVNSGSYPNLAVASFSCTYDGVSVLKISYDVTGAGGTKSVRGYAVKLLNTAAAVSALADAERVRVSAVSLAVWYPSPNSSNNWKSANYWNNAKTWDFILRKYPYRLGDVIVKSSIRPLMPESVIDAVVQKTIADYPSVFTQSNAVSLKSSIEGIVSSEVYLVPYFMQGTAQTSAVVNGIDDWVRKVAVCLVTESDAQAIRSGSLTHAATALVYYDGHWYFHYGNYHPYQKTIVPNAVFGNLAAAADEQMLSMLQGVGWYFLA